jgi:hypothetical protein
MTGLTHRSMSSAQEAIKSIVRERAIRDAGRASRAGSVGAALQEARDEVLVERVDLLVREETDKAENEAENMFDVTPLQLNIALLKRQIASGDSLAELVERPRSLRAVAALIEALITLQDIEAT